MQHMLQSAKRSVSVAVAAATIALSAGFAGLVAPSQANAASAGDLIKGSLSTVYYYGHDGERYVFPTEKTYFSWYSDFSDVTTISDSALAAIPLAGNVVYRPGSTWLKVTSAPDVYAVGTNGVLHHIDGTTDEGGEPTALDYAGSDWASRIHDLPDAFWGDYTVGSSLMAAEAFDGMLYMDGGNYYLAWDGEKRMVTSAGRSANNLQAGFFLDGSGIDDSSLSAGDDITGSVAALMDPAQTLEMGEEVSGDVRVSLASSTPAAASVPDNASGVKVATFAISATEDAEIDVLSVKLGGLASTSYIDSNGVYLYEGDERLTSGKSFNSSTRQATFGSLNFAVEGGETRYVSVLVDLADFNTDGAGANELSTSSFSVSIDDEADVEASGSVSGSFPISGSTMSVVDGTVGSVTITDTGSLSDPTVGQQDATIGKFKLAAGDGEDVSVERITLKIVDADDHEDFKLYQGSTLLASGENIGNDLVLFSLSSAYSIAENSNRDFTVTADVGGEATNTIDVYLDNSADLYAVGETYGFGVSVARTGYDGTTVDDDAGDDASNRNRTTIQGGEITVVFNGPAQSDVAPESEDLELYNFTITAERDISITDVDFLLTMTEADTAGDSSFETDPLSDIRLVNVETGALVAGPLELSATADADVSEDIAFTEEFDLSAGESVTLKLTADVEATADAGDTYTAKLDLTSGLQAEDADGTAVTDITPSTDLTGNAHTVVASGLTVSLASTPTGTTTIVRGTSGYEVVGYNLAAANGGDIEVTDLTVTVKVDHDGAGTYASGTDSTTLAGDRISSCSLYNAAGTKLSGPESVSSSTGEILFSNFSEWVEAGTTERWTVECDFANVDPGTADLFAWTILATDDVAAFDEDGDASTVSGTNINFTSSTPSAIVSLTGAGSLAVTASSDTPAASFILTGSTGTEVAEFRFDATNEAFTINRLTVTEEQAESDTGTTNSAAYANNVSNVTISYPTATGTATASGSLSGNELTFNNLGMYVAKNDRALLSVSVDVPSTSRSGGYATSNEKIRIGLSADDSTEFSATTASATITSLSTDGTASAGMNTFVVRETEPTVSLSSTTLPVGSAGGNAEVMRFNVAANAGEDVILDQLVFKLNLTKGGTEWRDVTTGAFTTSDLVLYNRDVSLSTAVAGTWTILDATADAWATSDIATFAQFVPTTAITVPANGTRSFSFWLDSTGADGDASVRVDLVADPIVAFDTTGATTISDASLTRADTTFDLASGTGITTGTILCNAGADTTCASGEERMLVVSVSTNTVSVVRGYLGTNQATLTNGHNIQTVPSSFVWQDDGNNEATESVDDMWGSYLVDGLTLYGQQFNY